MRAACTEKTSINDRNLCVNILLIFTVLKKCAHFAIICKDFASHYEMLRTFAMNIRQKIMLTGAWEMRFADRDEWLPATVPGSVYADLLDNGKMEDPYWRDNEYKAFDLMEKDYVYRRFFTLSASDLSCSALYLVFEGLDTVAAVTLNGQRVLSADNMHRRWEINVLDKVHPGENELAVLFTSPNRAAREAYALHQANGSSDCTQGFPAIRKAHCMYGWDWGPRLPDAGIWRDVYLLPVNRARLLSVQVRQKHENGHVTLSFAPENEILAGDGEYRVLYTLTGPDGQVIKTQEPFITVENPLLWWPNGYGDQPLYTLRAALTDENDTVLDVWERRIGLRTLTMRRQKDEQGESFETCVNGVSIFAMGADYIPEDNILRRVTRERTYALLSDAKAAHFNAVRVWGGGYYPDDFFYDACDEMGLIVWQDFMFACALYDLDDAFEQNIRAEFADNIRRLRHHASLGLWCGNNEMELGVVQHWYDGSPKIYADYVKMYEYIIPQVLKQLDPDTFYWPASPSSGGGFDYPSDPNRGDVHYWDVWHGNKPFTEYRKYLFRYVSEFGFQSFPCLKTVESFTLPQDRNIFSYVMEKHQRNNAANGKIMNYLAQTFLYPASFDVLLYASQLLQAEAIRYGVEHWRRNRGTCMGAIVWQLNDCWPVASWSSIDYSGRWKALHYAEKRFFAPVLLSCEEQGTLSQRTNVNDEMREDRVEKSVRLNVSNETRSDFAGRVTWALRDENGTVLQSGAQTVQVPALSALWLDKQVFPEAELYKNYVSFALEKDEECISSGTVLFCAPKHFRFSDPGLRVSRDGDELIVSASAYARSVEILCDDGDVLLDDNYFDLNAGSRRIRILRGQGTRFSARSVYDIR